MKKLTIVFLLSILVNKFALSLNIETDRMCSKKTIIPAKYNRLYMMYDTNLYKNFYDVLALKNFPKKEIPMLFCITKLESNFDSKAVNKNRNGTVDAGLFQINEIWKEKCHYKLYSTEDNIDCALIVFKAQGLNAWTTYKKYKDICSYSIDKYKEIEIESIANSTKNGVNYLSSYLRSRATL